MTKKENSEEGIAFENMPFIRGKTIDLCPRNSRYANLYVKWKNDPKVRKFARNIVPRTLEQQKERFERKGERFRENITFDIWYKQDNKPIGNCGLNRIDWVHGWANVFLLIGEPEYWNRNIATEATELLIDYAFSELNLNKLRGGAAVENIGSWSVAEKVGFKFEGIQKDEMYVDGKFVDNKLYRILKDDWLKKKINNE